MRGGEAELDGQGSGGFPPFALPSLLRGSLPGAGGSRSAFGDGVQRCSAAGWGKRPGVPRDRREYERKGNDRRLPPRRLCAPACGRKRLKTCAEPLLPPGGEAESPPGAFRSRIYFPRYFSVSKVTMRLLCVSP